MVMEDKDMEEVDVSIVKEEKNTRHTTMNEKYRIHMLEKVVVAV